MCRFCVGIQPRRIVETAAIEELIAPPERLVRNFLLCIRNAQLGERQTSKFLGAPASEMLLRSRHLSDVRAVRNERDSQGASP
jgi:hypothetical protein